MLLQSSVYGYRKGGRADAIHTFGGRTDRRYGGKHVGHNTKMPNEKDVMNVRYFNKARSSKVAGYPMRNTMCRRGLLPAIVVLGILRLFTIFVNEFSAV